MPNKRLNSGCHILSPSYEIYVHFFANWGKLTWDGGLQIYSKSRFASFYRVFLSNQVLIIVFLYKVGPDVGVESLVRCFTLVGNVKDDI